jgi:hypothetical protein
MMAMAWHSFPIRGLVVYGISMRRWAYQALRAWLGYPFVSFCLPVKGYHFSPFLAGKRPFCRFPARKSGFFGHNVSLNSNNKAGIFLMIPRLKAAKGDFLSMDLFNNPVGCFTRLADLANFLQKSAKSAVF